MSKTKTIKLSWPHPDPQDVTGGSKSRYRVESVTNSTTYNPGQFLCKAEVADLCDVSTFEVTVAQKRA